MLQKLSCESYDVGMRRGYARVSTTQQDFAIQVEELKAAGCERIYDDKTTGTTLDRPGLKRLMREVQAGDEVLVYKLDRGFRSLRDMLNVLYDLRERSISFRSLHDPINVDGAHESDPVAAAMARAQLQMLGVFAELERAFIVGRTSAGRERAKQSGVKFGRKPKIGAKQVAMARDMLAQDRTIADVAETLRVHRTTLWRHLEGLNTV